MADLGTAVPAGGEAPAQGASLQGAPDAGKPRSPLAEIGWGIASTIALFAWLAWSWGWTTAAAGLFSLFVHEGGHMLVINALGCGPSRLRIIPFLGGAATMARAPRTAFHGVLIAMAGPIAGLLTAVPFIVASRVTGDPRWIDGAGFIILINLLNMLPAPPLDGSKALGPALARIHPWVEKAVLVLIGAVAAYFAIRQGNILFGAFVAIATLAAARRTGRPTARPLNGLEWLATVGLWGGVLAAGVYAGLVSLGVGGWRDIHGVIHGSGF
jgi:Zn-dependent protease